MKALKRFRNNSGFSLIEVIMTLGVLAVVFQSFLFFSVGTQISSQHLAKKNAIIDFRQELLSAIGNSEALVQSVLNPTHNPSMSCLQQQQNCTGAGGEFSVLDANGNLIYSPSSDGGSAGLTETSVVCSGFSASTENPECPYRYAITWSPLCADASCTNPSIEIRGEFIRAANSQRANLMNAQNLGFNLRIRSEEIFQNSNLLAVADVVHVIKGGSVTFDVLNNDVLGKGAVEIIEISTPLSQTSWEAQAEISANKRQVSYTPDPDFNGLDLVTYKIQDTLGRQSTGKMWVKVMTPYTWTGEGNNGLWTDAKNWCGAVVNNRCTGASTAPNSLADVVFDETCILCNSQAVGVNFATKSLRTQKAPYTNGYSYPGRIDFNVSQLSVGPGADRQVDGQFKVESGEIVFGPGSTLLTSGNFNLEGGRFVAPTSWRTRANFTITNSAALSVPNNSTLWIRPYYSMATQVSTGGASFENLILGGGAQVTTIVGDIFVNKILTLRSGQDGWPEHDVGSRTYNGGRVNARGDVHLYHTGWEGGDGSTLIKLVGDNDQVIRSPYPITQDPFLNPYYRNPSIEIASTGGLVTFTGNFKWNRDFLYTSGDVDVSQATMFFKPSYSLNTTIRPGPIEFNQVILGGGAGDTTIVGQLISRERVTFVHGNEIPPDGSPSSGSPGNRYYLGGDILAYGDVDLSRSSGADRSTARLKIVGTANQSIIGANYDATSFDPYANPWLAGPSIDIMKTGGVVNFLGQLRFNRDFNYISGSVNLNNTLIGFRPNYSSPATINPGPLNFHHVVFGGGDGVTTISQPIRVLGKAFFTDGGEPGVWGFTGLRNYNGAAIEVHSDVHIKRSSGTSRLRLVGTENRSFTMENPLAHAYYSSLSLEIATAETATTIFSGDLRFTRDFIFRSGVINASNSLISFYPQYSLSTLIQLAAPISLRAARFEGSAGTTTITGRINVLEDLEMRAGQVGNRRWLAGGSLSEITVDRNLSYHADFSTSTIPISLVGTEPAQIASNGFVANGGRLSINKATGVAATLVDQLRLQAFGQNLILSQGDLRLNGNNLSVPFSGKLQVHSATTVHRAGGTIFGPVEILPGGQVVN